MSARRVSIEDVAADAQVSITTVSHALSGKRAVSPETLLKVQAAVARLDYRPNMAARSLRIQRSHTVALLVADITNPYYPAVARAVHDLLLPAGYVPFICNTDSRADTETTLLREMVGRGVDGLIVDYRSLALPQIRALVGDELPLVLIGPTQPATSADTVSTDDAGGILECVSYLTARGIQDIAFISGPRGEGPGDTRAAAFRDAARAHGIRVGARNQRRAPYTREGGAAVARLLLDDPRPPRAILCANDLIAIGALDAAKARGLRVPDDLSIVGFDDIDTADLVTPRLTTIHNPAAAVGTTSAGLLLTRLNGDRTAPSQHVSLPTRLVIRESA